MRIKSRKTFFILFLFLSSILLVSCSDKNNIIEFSTITNTTWISEDNALVLKFGENNLSIEMNVKPTMEESDFNKLNKYKDIYTLGNFEDIKIEKSEENNDLRVYNDDLNISFEIISKNKIKDESDNIFSKK